MLLSYTQIHAWHTRTVSFCHQDRNELINDHLYVLAPLPILVPLLVSILALCAGCTQLPVSTAPEKAVSAPAIPPEAPKPAPDLIRRGADGKVRIGLVTVDEKTRTLSIPAEVNPNQNIVEYALVTKAGKAHESIFVTDAAPLHIHLAAILLNFITSDPDGEPSDVIIEVEWNQNGTTCRVRLEKLVMLMNSENHEPTGETLSEGTWIYIGSKVVDGTLLAPQNGSIITVIGDGSALLANPRPDYADDKIHMVNSKLLPADGFPVTIKIRPAPPTAAKTPETTLAR